jgi:ferredoxin
VVGPRAGRELTVSATGGVLARPHANAEFVAYRVGRGALMGWRVVVDFDRCGSNAVCMAAAPEVFEVRDDDFLYVLQETPDDSLRPKVEDAVRQCPTQAISIVES